MTVSQYHNLRKIAQGIDPSVAWGQYSDMPKKAPAPQSKTLSAPTAKQLSNFFADHVRTGADSFLRNVYTSWAPIGHTIGGVLDAAIQSPVEATIHKIKYPKTSWADNYKRYHQAYWDAASDRANETIRSFNRSISKGVRRTPSAKLAKTVGDTAGGFTDPQSVITGGLATPVTGFRNGVMRTGQELGYATLDSMANPYREKAYGDDALK